MNASQLFISTIVMFLLNRIYLVRPFCTSSIRLSIDLADKRIGTKKKTDKTWGENDVISRDDSYELMTDKTLDRLFNGVKFSNIPILQIICTMNNTKITITDYEGKPIIIKTAGTEGFKNCRKGTTVAAQAVAKKVLSLAKDYEIEQLRVVFNGLGPGRNAAFRIFELGDVKLISLSDRTQAIEPWIKRPRRPKSL